MQKRLNITNQNQVQELRLNESNAKGLYLVRVYDAANQSVYTQKVMVK